MFTSYYGKASRNPKSVGISIGVPKWFKGKIAKELCPTWAMVKKGYEYEEYVEKVLSKLDPKTVYEKYKDNIMLCFEADRGHCHRGYLARWFKETLNIDVPEWQGDNADRKSDSDED